MMVPTCRLLLISGAFAALMAQNDLAVFRSDVRLVEVYATVFDHKGKYLDGLDAQSFQLLDEGKPQPIMTFESNQAELSCAVLLDTTGMSVDAVVERVLEVARGRLSRGVL